MNPGEGFRGAVLRHFTAVLLIILLLAFLYAALILPFGEYLSESAEGIIVGGFVSIISIIVNSLFQSEATRQASRQASDAAQQGANAALSQPPQLSPLPREKEIVE
jgi:hypothetical protein